MNSKSKGNKLTLNKKSIANLNQGEMHMLRSGDDPYNLVEPIRSKKKTALSECSCVIPVPMDFGIPTHD
jgi:hypothetical protein